MVFSIDYINMCQTIMLFSCWNYFVVGKTRPPNGLKFFYVVFFAKVSFSLSKKISYIKIVITVIFSPSCCCLDAKDQICWKIKANKIYWLVWKSTEKMTENHIHLVFIQKYIHLILVYLFFALQCEQTFSLNAINDMINVSRFIFKKLRSHSIISLYFYYDIFHMLWCGFCIAYINRCHLLAASSPFFLSLDVRKKPYNDINMSFIFYLCLI